MPPTLRRALEVVFSFHARDKRRRVSGSRHAGSGPGDLCLTRETCAEMFAALNAKAKQIEAAAAGDDDAEGGDLRHRVVSNRQLTDRHFRMLFDMLDADKRCVRGERARAPTAARRPIPPPAPPCA